MSTSNKMTSHCFPPMIGTSVPVSDCRSSVTVSDMSNEYETTDNKVKATSFLGSGNLNLPSLLATRMLTEIYGPSSSGKTQFALHHCLSVQLPKRLGGLSDDNFRAFAVYIATSPIQSIAARLRQMATGFDKLYGSHLWNGGKSQPSDRRSKSHRDSVSKWTDNVYIISVLDGEVLEHVIWYQLPEFVRRQNGRVKLVVIDSIASCYRYGSENTNINSRLPVDLLTSTHTIYNDVKSTRKRAVCLASMANSLKKVAYRNDIVALVINQVTSDFKENDNEDGTPIFKPCLGKSWSNMINVRLEFKKISNHGTSSLSDNEHEVETTQRHLKRVRLEKDPEYLITVKLSPLNKHETQARFSITDDGIRGMETSI